jgi:hypothetical protein
MALFTYIPSKVDIEISGYKVSGHTEVSFQLDNPQFTTVKGIRGRNTRIRSKNSSGVLTLGILQTSPTNDLLSEILKKDLQYGTGRLVIKIKDQSGSSLFFCDEAYIAGFPALSFSDKAGTRTWTINCLTVPLDQFVVGGNYKPVFDLF